MTLKELIEQQNTPKIKDNSVKQNHKTHDKLSINESVEVQII